MARGNSLRENFEDHNYNIIVSTVVSQNQWVLRENVPNVIILDCLLDKGLELCKRFKQERASRTIPVIIINSENKLQYMVQAYEAGADYCLVKNEEGSKSLQLLIDSILTRQARKNLSMSA